MLVTTVQRRDECFVHYCPECKYEYELRVSVCPDCNVALVDGVPPAKAEHKAAIDEFDDEAVLLIETQDMIKLRFLIDLLEQEGIPHATRKFTQYGGAADSVLFANAQATASAVGGRDKIYVAAEDLERAKALWEALQGQELTEDHDTGEEEETK